MKCLIYYFKKTLRVILKKYKKYIMFLNKFTAKTSFKVNKKKSKFSEISDPFVWSESNWWKLIKFRRSYIYIHNKIWCKIASGAFFPICWFWGKLKNVLQYESLLKNIVNNDLSNNDILLKQSDLSHMSPTSNNRKISNKYSIYIWSLWAICV